MRSETVREEVERVGLEGDGRTMRVVEERPEVAREERSGGT